METLPLPLDAIAAQGRDLADFRVGSPAEVLALLKQLADANVALTLSTPEGASCSATVWTLDPQRGLLCLSADLHDVQKNVGEDRGRLKVPAQEFRWLRFSTRVLRTKWIDWR